MAEITVVGGGLAGSEAAWQAAQRGLEVTLYEMRPGTRTPAHVTGDLAELVCSNSLGSNLVDRAPGLLKEELRRQGSLILACADAVAVPAGRALAVDRERFSQLVTERISAHPGIRVVRAELEDLPLGTVGVVATGPLTSATLSARIADLTSSANLFFYDAMAPIVTLESIDESVAFRASRYRHEGDDYINCPMTRVEYEAFWQALVKAERSPLRDFEKSDARFFEGCLPLEVLAERGEKALAFGPLKPVGLSDPRTGDKPYAVVQLRQDNLAGTLYNLVGFQTNLRWGEQERVFRMIPGLEHAEFVRFGQMHRNTYLNSPALLDPTMRHRGRAGLFFAGQITGTEGYVASTASGLVAGINAARCAKGQALLVWPATSMLGALCQYVSHADERRFQPMKPNFALLPPLDNYVRGRRDRFGIMARRALLDLATFMDEQKSES